MSVSNGIKVVVASAAILYGMSKVADKIIERRNNRILHLEKRLFAIMGDYIGDMNGKNKARFINNKMTQNAIKDFQSGLRNEEQVRQVFDFVKRYMVY